MYENVTENDKKNENTTIFTDGNENISTRHMRILFHCLMFLTYDMVRTPRGSLTLILAIQDVLIFVRDVTWWKFRRERYWKFLCDFPIRIFYNQSHFDVNNKRLLEV